MDKNKSRNILFWCGVLFTLIVPLIVGVFVKNANASWVTALCGAFIIFISKIDDIAELSLGPLRAKMKETIQKATATIDQLRDVSVTTTKVILTDLMAGNFMGGINLTTRLDLHDHIISNLKSIGVSDDKIEESEEMWKRGIAIIYHRGIRCVLEGRTQKTTINIKASPELRQASDEFQKMGNFEKWETPTPDEMENFINSKGFMNDQVKELISDYRHFLKTNTIRRREIFDQL